MRYRGHEFCVREFSGAAARVNRRHHPAEVRQPTTQPVVGSDQLLAELFGERDVDRT